MSRSRGDRASRRPVYKRKRVWLGGVVVVVLALAGRFVLVMANAEPGNSRDFPAELTQLTRDAQGADPDAPNKWETLSEAARLIEQIGRDVEREHFEELSASLGAIEAEEFNTFWMGDAQSASPEFSSSVAEAARRFRAAGGDALVDDLWLARCAVARVIEDEETAWTLEGETLGHTRRLTRFLLAEVTSAGRRGDWAALAQRLRQARSVNRLISGQANSLSRAVGRTDNEAVLAAAMPFLPSMRHDDAALSHIERTLHAPNLIEPETVLAALRLESLLIVQLLHTDDGSGDGRLILSEAGDLTRGGVWIHDRYVSVPYHRWNNALAIITPTKRQTIELLDEFYQTADQYQRAVLAGGDWQDASPDEFLERAPEAFVVARVVAPRIEHWVESESRARDTTAAGFMMIAAERYHRVHGEYPEDTPEMLAACESHLSNPLPPDSRVDLLAYHRLAPGDDPRGRPYVIFSNRVEDKHQSEDESLSRLFRTERLILNPPPFEPGASGP